MAVPVVAHRGKIHDTTNTTSYTTDAAYTPAANVLLVAVVIAVDEGTTDPTSVAGHGVTYSQKVKQVYDANSGAIWLYVADSGATPTSAAVVATWAVARGGASVMEGDGSDVDLSGGALAAIVQALTATGTGTSGSITLAAAGAADNRPLSMWVHRAAEVTNPRASWTELDDGLFGNPATGSEYQWRSDAFETTASASWASNVNFSGIAAEIKGSVAAAPAGIHQVLQSHIQRHRLRLPWAHRLQVLAPPPPAPAVRYATLLLLQSYPIRHRSRPTLGIRIMAAPTGQTGVVALRSRWRHIGLRISPGI